MKPKHLQAIAFVVVLAAAAALALLRERDAAVTFPQGDVPAAPVPGPRPPLPTADDRDRAAPPTVARPGVGFRSRAQFLDHFERHGGEFRAKTAAEYLRLAQSLRDAPKGGPVLEAVRTTDGVTTRFDRRTGAFLATNRDGTIRTFFRPDDGEAYFRRQLDREEDRP